MFLLVACLLDALSLSPSLFPCSIPFREGEHKCINNVLRSFNQTIHWLSANLEKKRKNSFSLQRSIILFLHSNFLPKQIIHVKNRISVSNLVSVLNIYFGLFRCISSRFKKFTSVKRLLRNSLVITAFQLYGWVFSL